MAISIDKNRATFNRATESVPPLSKVEYSEEGFSVFTSEHRSLANTLRRVDSIFSPTRILVKRENQEKQSPANPFSLSDGLKVLLGISVISLIAGSALFRLPIARMASLGALMLVSGCDNLKDFGQASPECDGIALREPLESWVNFAPGYVSAEEKASILKNIQQQLDALAILNPNFLCKLNGIEVTPDAEDISLDSKDSHRIAYYNIQKRKIYITKKQIGFSHEICHYLSDLWGSEHNKIYASLTEEWKKVSCVQQGWDQTNLENCIVPATFLKFYKDKRVNEKREEEHAQTCAYILDRGPLQFSLNSNTRNQTSIVMSHIGYSQDEIKVVSKIILPSEKALMLKSMATHLSINGVAASDASLVFTAPQGTLGFVADSHFPQALFLSVPSISNELYQFYLPNAYFLGDKISLVIPPPTVLYTYTNKQLIAYNKGILYFSDIPFKDWEERKIINQSLLLNSFPNDQLASVDEKITYFGKDHYWLLGGLRDSNDLQKEYPSEIQSALAQAKNVSIIYTSGKSFFWIDEGSISPVLDKKGRLFELRILQNEKDTSLSFEKVFEIPSSAFSDKPFFYLDSWYKFIHPTNAAFPLGVIRIEENGNKITSFEIDPFGDNSQEMISFTKTPSDVTSDGKKLTVPNRTYGFMNIWMKL